MADRMRLAGRTAVVTGAGSGIGRGIARALARRGCNLALADIDDDGLLGTLESLRAPGLRITGHSLDVADPAAVAAFPGVVRGEHPSVDLLVNNAGVALGGTFEQVSEEDFDWLFAINFRGPVRLTRVFLPLLRASDDARIVNISSVFGLVAPPGQTAYAASKFALRGFSESLRHELEGSRVGVSVVHPGGVATAIADRARLPPGATGEEIARRLESTRKLLRMPPDRAGEIIVRGIERRAPRILVGSDAAALAALVRLAPVAYWKAVARILPL